MGLPAEMCFACETLVTPRVEWATTIAGLDVIEATCVACLACLRRLPETPENVAMADADEAAREDDAA